MGDWEPVGPIRPIIRYSDVGEAVARANASPFALGGSVWGSDVAAATKVAARLESGSVWVNQHCALDPQVPFPANKHSGFGVEGGVEGLHPYLALQTINDAEPADWCMTTLLVCNERKPGLVPKQWEERLGGKRGVR